MSRIAGRIYISFALTTKPLWITYLAEARHCQITISFSLQIIMIYNRRNATIRTNYLYIEMCIFKASRVLFIHYVGVGSSRGGLTQTIIPEHSSRLVNSTLYFRLAYTLQLNSFLPPYIVCWCSFIHFSRRLALLSPHLFAYNPTVGTFNT